MEVCSISAQIIVLAKLFSPSVVICIFSEREKNEIRGSLGTIEKQVTFRKCE